MKIGYSPYQSARKNLNFKAVKINQDYKTSRPRFCNEHKLTDTEKAILDVAWELSYNDAYRTFLEKQHNYGLRFTPRNYGGKWYDPVYQEMCKETISNKEELLKVMQEIAAKSEKKSEYDIAALKTTLARIEEIDNAVAQRLAEKSSLVPGEYRKNKGFNCIAGYEKEKGILDRYFITEILKERNGQKANIPNSVLFFGPKGNGKTTFARAFAQEIGCEKPIDVKTGALVIQADKFLDKLSKAGQKAKESFEEDGKRQIIFIDEIGVVAGKKSPILPELEEFLKTCNEKYHTTVFAATNYPLRLGLPIEKDDTIFPYIVSMDPPGIEDKAKILKYYLDNRTDMDLNDKIYENLARMMQEKEKATNASYSIARIRNTVCEANDDKKINYDTIIKNIESEDDEHKPGISTEQLDEYHDAMEKIMSSGIIK